MRIILSRAAARALDRLDRPTEARLRAAVDRLAEAPMTRAPGRDVRPLAAAEGLWRLRVGDWRVIYVVHEGEKRVYVLAVRPRGGAYRP
ncbi:MAG TPA: type II toxin-antitoxin system RelE/ParE family toxin [Limnochordia bacterium]